MNKSLITVNRVIALAYVLVIVFGAYQVISALSITNKTGLVVLKASNGNAGLSVTENDHQVAIVGSGTAKIRIAPGTYLFGAANNGLHSGTVATVSLKKTTNANVNLGKNIYLRNAQDVTFDNTSALLSSGISSNQLEEFEEYIFEFDQNAQTVIVGANSVEPGPHDPNLIQPFTLNFNMIIDTTNYKATLSYTDVTDTSLTLYNLAGTPVFSASPSTAVSGD